MDAAAEIVSLYKRHARKWLALRQVGALHEKGWLDDFLGSIPERGSILDIGCGGGDPVASYFISRGSRLTGVDSSSEMIEIASARHPDHVWIEEDMRSLNLGQRFDGLIAWDSFFHLTAEDQRRMFPVFARHAAPNAALMFTSGPRDGEALGMLEGEVLYHASLSQNEYRSLLSENGFSVTKFMAEDPGCAGHTVWLCRASTSCAAD